MRPFTNGEEVIVFRPIATELGSSSTGLKAPVHKDRGLAAGNRVSCSSRQTQPPQPFVQTALLISSSAKLCPFGLGRVELFIEAKPEHDAHCPGDNHTRQDDKAETPD